MSRVQELTLKMLDAELTPAEQKELQGLITGERAAREHIAILDLEAALRAERDIDFTAETIARIQRIAGDATQKNVMDKIKARSSPSWKASTSGPRRAVSQRSATSTSQPRISVRRVRREKQSPFAMAMLAAASLAVVLGLALVYSQKSPANPAPVHALAILQSAPSGTVLTRNGAALKTEPETKILDGDKLDAASAAATVRYDDGTLVTIEPGASLSFSRPDADAGKMLRLSSGAIKAVVAKQPAETPMVIRGRHATVTVLGTQFSLASSSDSTRLDVTEGLVGMRRDNDGKSILVGTGEFAIASDRNDLLAQRIGQPPPPVQAIAPPPPATPAKGELAVIAFNLVDAGTGKEIPGFSPLTDGAKLELSKLPAHFSLIAITDPGEVGSLVFDMDGKKKMRVEASPPYAITTNWDKVRYMPWKLAPGTHTLTATPYSARDAKGKVGKPLTINFTIVPR